MTFPNEFQQLDEDLAAGRLSPEDHRQRRDELERGAVSAPQVASPFPPAFRWEASAPEAATQVMYTVPPDVGEGDGQVRDLFQPVNSPASNPANNNADHSAPPWAGSDLLPIAEQQSAWMRQGPEVFTVPAMQSRSKQVIGIAVLAVLVFGLVGAGVAYSLSTGSPNQLPLAQPNQGQPDQSPPPAAARALPAPPDPRPAPVDTTQAVIDPPGRTRGGGGLLDIPLVQSGNLVPRTILNALRAASMTDGVLKTTTDGTNTIGMFAFTLADEQAATEVAKTIATVQRYGGLKDDYDRAQQGVTVLGTDPGSPSTVYRAVYVLYNRVIYFETMGPNRDAVQATFDSLIHQQVTYAPPTVRTER